MRLSILFLACVAAFGQTTVYLRDSAPAAVPVCGASYPATPVVVQTCTPHLFVIGNLVAAVGVATGTGFSPINHVHQVIAVSDSTHFAIGDVITGAPVAATGAWFDGSDPSPGNHPGGPQWVGLVHAYTLGAQPLGWLDGPTGAHTRKLSLGTANGLTSVIVTGCPGACLATVLNSYNHLLTNGDKVGIWGSGNSALDNGHAGYAVTVTGAQSFTFVPAAGSTNGTKTGVNLACGPAATPNDTIGGTADCLRISQLAWTSNPIWDGMETALTVTNMTVGTNYKSFAQGGLVEPGFQSPGWYANAAMKFLVDQSNAQMFAAAMYNFNNVEQTSGVNWTGNELAGNSNINIYTSDFLSYQMNAFAMVYAVMMPYASAAHKATTLNKLFNDVDDPLVTPCSRLNGDVAAGHNEILATGVAQGGSGTTIVLAAGDAHADNFYVNNVVLGSFSQYAVITGYVASTKTATISGSWVAPGAGQAYTIYASVSSSNATGSTILGGVTATVTGYNTHFTTRLAIGDAILGQNSWNGNPDQSNSYVCGGPGGCGTPITSDTVITVINATNPTTNAVPSLIWYFPQWAPGDCGMYHRNEYWGGSPRSQPTNYHGGGAALATFGSLSTDGGNNTTTWAAGHLVLDLVTCPDDARACRDLTAAEGFGFDYQLRHYMNYGCPMHSGSAYTYGNTMRGVQEFATQLAASIPTFPDMDLAGAWVNSCSIFKMFATYADLDPKNGNLGSVEIQRYGTDTDNNVSNLGDRFLTVTGVSLDPVFAFSPLSTNAKFLRNWLENAGGHSMWGYQGVEDDLKFAQVLYQDNRIVSSAYTAQPLQYAFHSNSSTRCAALTGWPCPPLFRGDAVVSRTSWTDKAATTLYYGSRTWWGDHDNPENGTLRIYTTGELLASDFVPPGGGVAGNQPANPNQPFMGDMLLLGPTASTVGGIFAETYTSGTSTAGITPITRWAAQYAGALGPAYGDQNSKYMHVCSELSGAYLATINHAQRCVTDFKKPGADHFVVQHDDVDVTGHAIAIETHLQYNQNAEAGVVGFTYPEGDTTCPGAGSCGALDTNREIRSLEDGGTNGVTARTSGLITHFLSPGTITLRDDAAVNSIVPSAVTKTIVTNISSFLSSGFITIIQTATAHGLLSNEHVMFTSVTGTGCTGPAGFNSGVFQYLATVIDATHFSVPFDTRSVCTSPSGGTVTTTTVFTATAHGISNLQTIKLAGATGDWLPWNQAGFLCEFIDVDHFAEYSGSTLDSSAYTTTFNGTFSRFYPGGAGHTHRVTIAAGGTIGASVNTFEHLVIHKIANGLSDTALTTTAINPDANWTGVQMCGVVSCSVYMGARHGLTQTAMAGFVTTHPGTAQYLFGGLTPGSGYAITVNGTPVTGSPFTVPAGDSSIEFESTAGTVSLNGGVATCQITTTTLPGGTVSTAYSQTIATSSCTSPIAWTISAGTLCAGLSIGASTGVISGTPTGAQTCSFTAQAVDAVPTTVAQALSITISGSPVLTLSPTTLSYACTLGAGNPGNQTVAVGATGIVLDNWSATKTQTWLTLSPTSNTVASNITASVNCSGQTAGTKTDTITAASTTGSLSNQTVAVTLVVSAAAGTATGIQGNPKYGPVVIH